MKTGKDEASDRQGCTSLSPVPHHVDAERYRGDSSVISGFGMYYLHLFPVGWGVDLLPSIISIYAALMTEPPGGQRNEQQSLIKAASTVWVLPESRLVLVGVCACVCVLFTEPSAGAPLNIIHQGWAVWVVCNLSAGSGSHIIHTAALLPWICSPRAPGLTTICGTGANMGCLGESGQRVSNKCNDLGLFSANFEGRKSKY